MEFKTYPNRPIAPFVRPMLIIFGVIISIIGVITQQYYELFAGIIAICIASYRKDTVIVEEGIEFRHRIFTWVHEEFYPYTRLTNVRIEYLGEKTGLHTMENHIVRRMLVNTEDVKNIIVLMRKKNDAIYVDYLSAHRR